MQDFVKETYWAIAYNLSKDRSQKKDKFFNLGLYSTNFLYLYFLRQTKSLFLREFTELWL